MGAVPDTPAPDLVGDDTHPGETPPGETFEDLEPRDWCFPDPGEQGDVTDSGPEGDEGAPLDIPPDAGCTPPSFSDDCSLVTEFQCGFQAWCEKGVLHAAWHHHWFCEGEEVITPFECSYTCQHGCVTGEIVDWPSNGQVFVETHCSQCSQPSDCEGLDHPMCVGYWTCEHGRCGWVCDSECVGEGGSVPVVPGAPQCCPGLVKVPCDAPDPEGVCQMCVGASLCTYCGDGNCGTGENKCNCPEDCGEGCLGLGGQFMDFDTEGKCCEGLVPMDDCVPSEMGCACPDCPCHICLPCGDGECGPYENECNCPADCGKCVEEGESVPVVPDAPQCCPGLVKVPCDAPGPEGLCQPCEGASICTRCGDGECGKGENICNCPSDCGGGCLGLGETFLDFNTAGKCCPGLKPMSDCDLDGLGNCSCPKCPCYICLPCGDGVCGPFEHLCNCPEDCPTAEKCVPTQKSACQGDPYGSDPAGTLKVEVVGHDITLHHEDVVLNCCLETTVCFTPGRATLDVFERQGGGTPCFCNCLFDIVATLPGIQSGTYDLTLYNEEQGKVLFTQTVEVP